jgi:hypothetical protein
MSSCGGQAVESRHCTRGCAITPGAAHAADAATAAAAVFAKNLRRTVVIPSPSRRRA